MLTDANGNAIAPRKTYRAAIAALVAPAANTIFFWFGGSATKTIKIKRVIVSGLTLTAVAYLSLNLKKNSSAPATGTSTDLTKVPLDSADPAAASDIVAKGYTAAPGTPPTPVGSIGARRVLAQSTTAAAAGIPDTIEFDFTRGDFSVNPPVLRGIAQGISLNFDSVPATAVTMNIEVEWTEEV